VDFRMPGDEPLAALLHRRLVEVAEPAAEGDQLLVGQRLIPEEQHLIIEPGAVNRCEGTIVDRAQVDALHFRAERGVHRPDAEGAIAGWRWLNRGVVRAMAHIRT